MVTSAERDTAFSFHPNHSIETVKASIQVRGRQKRLVFLDLSDAHKPKSYVRLVLPHVRTVGLGSNVCRSVRRPFIAPSCVDEANLRLHTLRKKSYVYFFAL